MAFSVVNLLFDAFVLVLGMSYIPGLKRLDFGRGFGAFFGLFGGFWGFLGSFVVLCLAIAFVWWMAAANAQSHKHKIGKAVVAIVILVLTALFGRPLLGGFTGVGLTTILAVLLLAIQTGFCTAINNNAALRRKLKTNSKGSDDDA